MGVYEVDKGTLLFRCKYWFEEQGVAHCGNDNDYHFKFKRGKDRTGKFIIADLGLDYLLGEDEDCFLGDCSDVPRIGIGTCVRVD
jgi:hypothetical protein